MSAFSHAGLSAYFTFMSSVSMKSFIRRSRQSAPSPSTSEVRPIAVM